MQIATDAESSVPKSLVTGQVARVRLLTGLLQGVLLYAMYYATKHAIWPVTNAYFSAPLALCLLFVPILFTSAIGHLDRSRLWKWILAATVICIALGLHDAWRMDYVGNGLTDTSNPSKFVLSGLLIVLTAGGLFIAHALVMAAAEDAKRIARYYTYFEVAWKLAIQVMFSLLFVGVLWLILWLGASLFMLVKLSFLRSLLDQPWFVIPMLTFAFSTALHVTDVRPRIVQGIRGLLLTLMSWLLPISVLIVGGFLMSLPFAGLEPLWATRHASSVLLGATALLVVLINAAFQNGRVAPETARVLKMGARLACVALLPLMVIAIHAVSLRVQQYGWTVDRIKAVACLMVGTCYAIGYLWAACERGQWLSRIAHTNIIAAFIVVFLLFALFSPIADPARLSVHSQMARLDAGKTPVADFDFHYLRFEGVRYGNAALQELKSRTQGADAELLRHGAEAALAKTNKWDRTDNRRLADDQSRSRNIRVLPSGQNLPADFLGSNWDTSGNAYLVPDCLRYANAQCVAHLIDMDADGVAEILVEGEKNVSRLFLFKKEKSGLWRSVGMVEIGYGCEDTLQSLQDGRYQVIPPEFNDLQVDGRRLRFQPWFESRSACKQ
ncbi:DUF4153 domain-containing protein [Oxalicibacterium faecigallinarum]|uniref:DUF4153 domain-containing protein n=1 Tax=Oxalicibacterium faecigallinarum TaxID=573741 RepID=A0A8J3ASI6_9BURK|nr:DUF4153 domain-containing protein [Oxalicibacterium faecigallinarum]GGI19190.1 DUF4153 domain-containing protein [Oxalicibacterium faecigallinarum]